MVVNQKKYLNLLKHLIFQLSEEAVILHLNIKNNKDSILNIEDEFVKYNPSINIPTPFIPDDLENAFYLKDNEKNPSILNPNENENENEQDNDNDDYSEKNNDD